MLMSSINASLGQPTAYSYVREKENGRRGVCAIVKGRAGSNCACVAGTDANQVKESHGQCRRDAVVCTVGEQVASSLLVGVHVSIRETEGECRICKSVVGM